MAERILIVDDDVDGLKITAMMLQRGGDYEIIPAYSGMMGLERARSHQPDLILLDGMMPDMDGVEVVRRIRADSEISHLPIILYTARTHVSERTAAFEAGADDYLTKPTHPRELVARIKALLARDAPAPTTDAPPTVSEDQRGYVALVNLLTHPDLPVRGTAVIALSVLRRQTPIFQDTPAQDAFWRNVYHNLGSMAETAPAHWGELSELARALTLSAAGQNIRLRELTASSDNMDIRISAARALGQNRDAESTGVLQACVGETDNSKLVAAALEALGLIGGTTGGDDALPVILSGLDSPSTAVRFAAVNALAFIGSDAAVKHLRALLDSPNSATRIDAIRALARPESRIAADIAVRMLLVVAVRDRDANVLHTVAQTLGQLDTPQSDDVLRMLLNHESDHVKNGARKGIEALARLRAKST